MHTAQVTPLVLLTWLSTVPVLAQEDRSAPIFEDLAERIDAARAVVESQLAGLAADADRLRPTAEQIDQAHPALTGIRAEYLKGVVDLHIEQLRALSDRLQRANTERVGYESLARPDATRDEARPGCGGLNIAVCGGAAPH